MSEQPWQYDYYHSFLPVTVTSQERWNGSFLNFMDISGGYPNSSVKVWYINTLTGEYILLWSVQVDEGGTAHREWVGDDFTQLDVKVTGRLMGEGDYPYEEPEPEPSPGKTCMLVALGVPGLILSGLRLVREFLPLWLTGSYYKLSVFILNKG